MNKDIKEELQRLAMEREVYGDMADFWNKKVGAITGKMIEIRKNCKHDFEKTSGHYAGLQECKICGHMGRE